VGQRLVHQVGREANNLAVPVHCRSVHGKGVQGTCQEEMYADLLQHLERGGQNGLHLVGGSISRWNLGQIGSMLGTPPSLRLVYSSKWNSGPVNRRTMRSSSASTPAGSGGGRCPARSSRALRRQMSSMVSPCACHVS
jgi:hypothetical protein